MSASWLKLVQICCIVGLSLVALTNVMHMQRPDISLHARNGQQARRALGGGQSKAHGLAGRVDWQAMAGSRTLQFTFACRDMHSDCPYLARHGKCTTMLDATLSSCMKSCGVCGAVKAAALTANTDSMGLSLSLATSSSDITCADTQSSEGCEAHKMLCRPDAGGFLSACKATCKICSGTDSDSSAASVKDLLDVCGLWAVLGLCSSARLSAAIASWWWVLAACPATCRQLLPVAAALGQQAQTHGSGPQLLMVGEGADGKGAAVPVDMVSDGTACKDTQAACSEWHAKGECTSNAAFMASACPDSCGTCSAMAMVAQPLRKVRLNNGVLMPTVGYGCAGLGDAAQTTVAMALEAGFRHLDSAQAREWYREDLVGAALHASAVPREQVFITSKLHPRHIGYERTLTHFNQSLKDLNTTYLDQFLLHYPECWGSLCSKEEMAATRGSTFLDTWRAFEVLYQKGLVRSIGVSNFATSHLVKLLGAASVVPQVLQVHVDPLGYEPQLLNLARHHAIQVVAYSTLGTQYGGVQNPVLTSPELMAIAKEVNKSVAQVALRWALQSGLVVLPRSANKERIAQNLQLFDFELSLPHMQRIAKLRKQ